MEGPLWSLAVKERLRSRCINVDATCNACGHHSETICHVLFSCPFAQDVWHSIGYPQPPAGFSVNSVFLNFHYLLESSKNRNIDYNLWRTFSWNSLLFEKTQTSLSDIMRRAMDDADVWFQVNFPEELLLLSPLWCQTMFTTRSGRNLKVGIWNVTLLPPGLTGKLKVGLPGYCTMSTEKLYFTADEPMLNQTQKYMLRS